MPMSNDPSMSYYCQSILLSYNFDFFFGCFFLSVVVRIQPLMFENQYANPDNVRGFIKLENHSTA